MPHELAPGASDRLGQITFIKLKGQNYIKNSVNFIVSNCLSFSLFLDTCVEHVGVGQIRLRSSPSPVGHESTAHGPQVMHAKIVDRPPKKQQDTLTGNNRYMIHVHMILYVK